MADKYSRRRLLVGTGLVATATTSSLALSSNNAMATASVSGDFSVSDGETVLADTQLQDIRLKVDAAYSFQSNADIHAVELELHVGETESTLDLIARHEQDGLGKRELAGDQELNGSLMSSSDFSISDFTPSSGELRRTVLAELRFYALRNEEVAAEAKQSASFDVVVRDEELSVEVSLGGEGEVVFETGE